MNKVILYVMDPQVKRILHVCVKSCCFLRLVELISLYVEDVTCLLFMTSGVSDMTNNWKCEILVALLTY